MSLKELTDKDKDYIKTRYLNYDVEQDGTKEDLQETLGKEYDVTGRTIRSWLKALGVSQNVYKRSLYNHPQYIKAKEREIEDSEFYLITSEQNKTPYCKTLLQNMEVFAKEIGGQILVSLSRYQNPTSIYKNDTRINNSGWHKELEKYHITTNIELNNRVSVRADIKVRPTAVNPLSGFKSLGGESSSIIPHPKLHMETMVMPKGYDEKVLLTTGSLTYRNYTDSKAGAKGRGKHKLGFTLVEIVDENQFFIHQIEADEFGNFNFLDYKLSNGKLTKENKVEAVIFGDTHGHRIDVEIDKLNDRMVEKLKPNYTIFHDITDGESVNNHIDKKPFEQYERYEKGNNLIKEELSWLKNFIKSKLDKSYKGLKVIRSNHDDRFDRYLEKMDWKKDIPNAKEYMKYSLAILEGDAPKGIIPYFIDENFYSEDVETLDYDDSLIIGRYECGMHGHIGVNGSRGTINSFTKIDIPTITAHTHSTGRKDDTLVVGKNTEDDLGYNIGPDNNSNSNAIIHKSGIAQQVLIIKGKISKLF